VKPGQSSVVITGTLYKEMSKKPCILSSVSGVLRDGADNYCTEEDFIVLEDSSGRIRIKSNEIVHPGKFVTGSIVAFKGQVD
jgi:hypothetical protein